MKRRNKDKIKVSKTFEPADNLELERDDSGGTEDSMEGELVGSTLSLPYEGWGLVAKGLKQLSTLNHRLHCFILTMNGYNDFRLRNTYSYYKSRVLVTE